MPSTTVSVKSLRKPRLPVPRVIASDGYLGEYGKTMIAVFHDAAKENKKLQVHFE